MALDTKSIFEHDDGQVWLDAFESDGVSSVQSALTTLMEMDAGDYIPAMDAAHALAAAEMVAAARDDDTSRLPGSAIASFEQHRGDIDDADLASTGRKAVTRILKNSELKDDAEAGDDAEAWSDHVRELLERLKG